MEANINMNEKILNVEGKKHEFELANAVESLRSTQDRMQKLMFMSLTFYLSSVIIYIYSKDQELNISIINVKIDLEIMVYILIAIGSVCVFIRSLVLMNARALYAYIHSLYRKLYSCNAPVWILFRPGILLQLNRLRFFGFKGQLIRFVLWFLMLFMPFYLVIHLYSFDESGFYAIVSIFPALVGIYIEVAFTNKDKIKILITKMNEYNHFDVNKE